jgi:hypothetical protein
MESKLALHDMFGVVAVKKEPYIKNSARRCFKRKTIQNYGSDLFWLCCVMTFS